MDQIKSSIKEEVENEESELGVEDLDSNDMVQEEVKASVENTTRRTDEFKSLAPADLNDGLDGKEANDIDSLAFDLLAGADNVNPFDRLSISENHKNQATIPFRPMSMNLLEDLGAVPRKSINNEEESDD